MNKPLIFTDQIREEFEVDDFIFFFSPELIESKIEKVMPKDHQNIDNIKRLNITDEYCVDFYLNFPNNLLKEGFYEMVVV